MSTRKDKKKIILIVILICVLLIIGLMYLTDYLRKKQVEEENADFQEFAKEYESQTILPRKIYELYNYEGTLDRDYLYKSMKVFVDYLDYLKENVDETNMSDFYNENTDDINSKMGIDNQKDFEDFVVYIKNKNVELDELKYAEVEVGSSYTKNNYFWFNIFFYYGEDVEPVTVTVGFSTLSDANVKVKYQIAE